MLDNEYTSEHLRPRNWTASWGIILPNGQRFELSFAQLHPTEPMQRHRWKCFHRGVLFRVRAPKRKNAAASHRRNSILAHVHGLIAASGTQHIWNFCYISHRNRSRDSLRFLRDGRLQKALAAFDFPSPAIGLHREGHRSDKLPQRQLTQQMCLLQSRPPRRNIVTPRRYGSRLWTWLSREGEVAGL